MIDSIHSNGLPVPPQSRPVRQSEQPLDALRAAEDGHQHESQGARERNDSVELSDAALELADQAGSIHGDVPGRSTLSAQRIATIVDRLNQGFYDGETVRSEIARRILPDL